jgi:hypothetical protein
MSWGDRGLFMSAAIQLYLWLLDLLGEESYNELSAATTGSVKVYGNLYSWRGHRCTNPGNEKKVDMNNPLSPQLIEHQKDHDIWSWKSCLGTGTYFHNSSDVSKVERVIGGQPNMFCFSKVCLMPNIQVFKRSHTFIINIYIMHIFMKHWKADLILLIMKVQCEWRVWKYQSGNQKHRHLFHSKNICPLLTEK